MSEDNLQGTGRTLGGSNNNNEPLPPSWSRQNSAQPTRIGRIGEIGSSDNNARSSSYSGGTRIAGLSDIPSSSSRQPPPSTHSDNDDDDDDEDYDDEAHGEDERESWFAGGERSGLSVQNPDRPGQGVPSIVRDLLRKASEASPSSSEDRPVVQRAFSGTGYTLGSDEVNSTIVPDSNGSSRTSGERIFRLLTLWRNGFSIEDGPLIRYDDPEHEHTLKLIFAGQAPLHLLNVEIGQPVELRLVHKTNEDYVPPPPKPFSAFEGSGNRLGAQLPNVSGAGSSSNAPMPGAFPSSSSSRPTQAATPNSSASNAITKFEVDQTKPTTSVQIRLADGTRIVCRMNLTHTVGDIRSFINAARPENLARAYTIGTTFPNRTLTDDQATIEGAGLVNSVVVQRWA